MSRAVAEYDPANTARLEKALALMAYIVLKHGDAYAPLLDRLEREVEESRRHISTRDRAQRILAGLSREVTHARVA